MDAGDRANVTWSLQDSHTHGKGLCADAQGLELTMVPAVSLHLHLDAILQVPNHVCMALTAPCPQHLPAKHLSSAEHPPPPPHRAEPLVSLHWEGCSAPESACSWTVPASVWGLGPLESGFQGPAKAGRKGATGCLVTTAQASPQGPGEKQSKQGLALPVPGPQAMAMRTERELTLPRAREGLGRFSRLPSAKHLPCTRLEL